MCKSPNRRFLSLLPVEKHFMYFLLLRRVNQEQKVFSITYPLIKMLSQLLCLFFFCIHSFKLRYNWEDTTKPLKVAFYLSHHHIHQLSSLCFMKLYIFYTHLVFHTPLCTIHSHQSKYVSFYTPYPLQTRFSGSHTYDLEVHYRLATYHTIIHAAT